MSLTQRQRQSLICFVVKAVLFLISVVMEMLRCHMALEVSFCAEEERSIHFAAFTFALTASYFMCGTISHTLVLIFFYLVF